jgi:hypothetical protein
MPRGGKREGAGAPKKYQDSVEIRIRCNREFREALDNFLKQQGISDRNVWLQKLIEEKISYK